MIQPDRRFARYLQQDANLAKGYRPAIRAAEPAPLVLFGALHARRTKRLSKEGTLHRGMLR